VRFALDILLSIAVAAAWFTVLAYFRLRTPFERLHAVTFINIAGTAPIVLAAFLSDGVGSRSLKCVFILVFVLPASALLAHVTGRALHVREGERR
jgi:multicomponent Na+:H+ antiporter subunit G